MNKCINIINCEHHLCEQPDSSKLPVDKMAGGKMKIYELRCLDQDGYYESNGFFFYKTNAEEVKKEMDNYPMNTKYGIIQNIIKHEMKDKLVEVKAV